MSTFLVKTNHGTFNVKAETFVNAVAKVTKVINKADLKIKSIIESL